MGKPRKNSKKSLKKKSDKQSTPQLKTYISPEIIAKYFDAAKITDSHKRNNALENFFSNNPINSIDINTLTKLIAQTSEYSREHYLTNPAPSTEDAQIRDCIEKINLFHTTLEKLLPLCDSSTNELKNIIIQKDFFGLLFMINHMAERYYHMKLYGEQFFDYYEQIIEKSAWHNSYVETYQNIQLAHINKNGLSASLWEEISQTINLQTNLLHLYHHHASFSKEKEELLTAVNHFIQQLEKSLYKKITDTERKKRICKKDKQLALQQEIVNLENVILQLGSHHQLVEYSKRMPPISKDTLIWHSFLDKMHSVYKSFRQNESSIQQDKDVSPSAIEAHIANLKKINQHSSTDNLDKDIAIINNILDLFKIYKQMPQNKSIEIHDEISLFMRKNLPKDEGHSENNARLMHYAGESLFTEIKEKILLVHSKKTFDINGYINAAKIINTKTRNHSVDELLGEPQDNSFDLNTLLLIKEKVQNIGYSSFDLFDMITIDLESVNILQTSLNKILPLCESIDEHSYDELNNLYCSKTISILIDLINNYSENTELKPNHYIEFFNNIEEKIYWLVNEKSLEKYQIYNLNLVKSEKTPIETKEEALDDLQKISMLYSYALDFLNNHPYLKDHKDKMLEKASSFITILRHSQDTPSLDDLLQTNNICKELKSLIKSVSEYKNDTTILRDFFEKAIAVYEAFHLREKSELYNQEINLNELENNTQKLSSYNKKPFNSQEIDDILKNIIITLNALDLYAKTSPQYYTKEIITKHNALCKIALQLVTKIKDSTHAKLIYEVGEKFIKDVFASTLNDLRVLISRPKKENPVISKNTSKFSPSKAAKISVIDPIKEEIVDIENIEESVKKLNLNHVTFHELATQDSMELVKNTKNSEIEKTQASMDMSLEIEPSCTLNFSGIEAANQKELEELNQRNSRALEELNQAYQLRLKEIQVEHQREMEKIQKEHKSKIKTKKSMHKREIIAAKKKSTEKTLSFIKECEDNLNMLEKDLNKKLDTLYKTLDISYKNVVKEKESEYDSKALELNKNHLNSIENEISDFQNRLRNIDLVIHDRLSSLKEQYKKEFVDKKNVLIQKESGKFWFIKSKFEKLLTTLNAEQARNIEIYEEYVSDIFREKIEHAEDALKELDAVLNDYSVNNIARIIRNYSQSKEQVNVSKNHEKLIEEKQLLHNKSVQAYHPIHHLKIPAEVQIVLSLFKDANIEAYICGAWIRNILLGIIPDKYDIDIIVNTDSEQAKSILKGYGLQNSHQSSLVKLGNLNFWCDPWDNNLVQKLDDMAITMDTLVCNEDGVFDLLNIKQTFNLPKLTILGNDTTARFEKNPSLILQCLKLTRQLNKPMTDEDWIAVWQNAHHIANLPLGIYLNNIENIFCAKNALDYFYFIHLNKLLPYIFPFLKEDDLFVNGSPMYNFMSSKLCEFSHQYQTPVSPIAVLSLMMFIVIMQNQTVLEQTSFLTTNFNLSKNEKLLIEEELCLLSKNIIEERLKAHPILLDQLSIKKSIEAYCFGSKYSNNGYLQEYVGFYQTHYLAPQTESIFENPYLNITPQYTRRKSSNTISHQSLRSSDTSTQTSRSQSNEKTTKRQRTSLREK